MSRHFTAGTVLVDLPYVYAIVSRVKKRFAPNRAEVLATLPPEFPISKAPGWYRRTMMENMLATGEVRFTVLKEAREPHAMPR